MAAQADQYSLQTSLLLRGHPGAMSKQFEALFPEWLL